MTASKTYVRALIGFADARHRPVDVHVPNTKTRKAMAELASGKGERVSTVKALMAGINA